ncbi:MAG: hypothetical protein J07HQW2_02233, partial [Haloquadratum walsbyi J07HQW2]
CVLAPVREQLTAGIFVGVFVTESVLGLTRFVQAVEVRLAVFSIDTDDFDVARVGVVGLEVNADSPLTGVF